MPFNAYVIEEDLHPELDSPKQSLLLVDGGYYVVSSVTHTLPGTLGVALNETMVFRGNPFGEVIDHTEVFAVTPANHEGVIEALLTPEPWEDPYYFLENDLVVDEDIAYEDQQHGDI